MSKFNGEAHRRLTHKHVKRHELSCFPTSKGMNTDRDKSTYPIDERHGSTRIKIVDPDELGIAVFSSTSG